MAGSRGCPLLCCFESRKLPEQRIRSNTCPSSISTAHPRTQVIEPNAMCLSTVGEGGKPSARFVLMKGYDERGVTWYTNYNRCVLVRRMHNTKAYNLQVKYLRQGVGDCVSEM